MKEEAAYDNEYVEGYDGYGEGYDGYGDEGYSTCGCGGSCDPGSCGGGCAGCGGGPQILFEGKNAGKVVRVHYTGTYNDGTKFDSSYDRNEPLEFVCAAGMMIPGFDRAVAEMEPGDVIDVHLMPEEAYGMPREDMIVTFSFEDQPEAAGLKVGDHVLLGNPYGQQFPATVCARTDTDVTLDANHEMAGKELNFKIELIEVL